MILCCLFSLYIEPLLIQLSTSGYGCNMTGLYRACDVLEMSVVRVVDGVCDMCMCLARGGVGGVGGELVTGLGLGFTNSGGI